MAESDDQTMEFDEIELLVISPMQETAEIVQTQLRDAGHNVHASWLDKPENLAEELQRQIPRLICCQENSGQQELNRLIGLCLNIARGIPILAVVPELDPEITTELLQAGAAQVISPEHPVLLTRALERELASADLNAKLKLSRRQISALRRQLGAIVAESPEAIAYVHEGIHTHLNLSYAKLFGFSEPDELEGVPLMDLVAPQSRDKIKKLLSSATKAAKKKAPESIKFVAQRADETNVSLNMRCRAASMGGEDQIEVQVAHTAGAVIPPPPANAFEGRMAIYQTLSDSETLRLKDHNVGLVFICVDALEKLQDRLGLLAVDKIMGEVSLFLLDILDDKDRSFRFDVGEFIVLVSAESTAKIEATAEKICAAIGVEIFGDESASSSLTASISVAHLAEAEDNTNNLLKALRLARKTSVREGNTVVVASTADRAVTDREADLTWLERIKTSLARDTFTLAYQSIASLEGDPSHYDVQLRMIGDKGEAIRPGEFLPTAQRHGLMPSIDQWVLRQAMDVIRIQQSKKEHTLMFVKLSKASIDGSDVFLPWLQKQIAEYKIDKQDLALAFDEDYLQFNTRKAAAVFQELQEIGLKVAIHGFGNSSNSLQLLDVINTDYIRLDPSFTEALASPEQDKRLGDTMQVAKTKKIKIIASHVEDANSMSRLWTAGVNYIQGYFVQEPGNSAQ